MAQRSGQGKVEVFLAQIGVKAIFVEHDRRGRIGLHRDLPERPDQAVDPDLVYRVDPQPGSKCLDCRSRSTLVGLDRLIEDNHLFPGPHDTGDPAHDLQQRAWQGPVVERIEHQVVARLATRGGRALLECAGDQEHLPRAVYKDQSVHRGTSLQVSARVVPKTQEREVSSPKVGDGSVHAQTRLRSCKEITWSFPVWENGVVPLGQYLVGFQQDVRLLLNGDLLFGSILPAVQHRLTVETGRRGRGADVVQDCLVADQGLPRPVLADQVEHPMLDPIPLRGPGRVVRHCDRHIELVSQPLQADPPRPQPISVGPAAVCLDQPLSGIWVTPETGLQPPRPQGFSGELSCLMRRSDHHEAGVPSLVVNSKRDGPADGIAGEVVVQDVSGIFPPASARVLEVANQLLLLGVHAEDGQIPAQVPPASPFDEPELPITLRLVCACQPFTVGSQRVVIQPQQTGDGCVAYPEPTSAQLLGQLLGRLVSPPQPGDRIASRIVGNDLSERRDQIGIFFSIRLRPPPGRRTRSEDSGTARWISSTPRRIVVRLIPVIVATSTTPPRPRSWANTPTNNRLPRSLSETRTRLIA